MLVQRPRRAQTTDFKDGFAREIMAVPKKKTSKSRRNMRRSHDALTPTFAVVCPQCGDPTLRHRACPSCGHYRGKKVVEVNEDL